jgi:hypothetical protein
VRQGRDEEGEREGGDGGVGFAGAKRVDESHFEKS